MGRKSAPSADPFTDLWRSHLHERFRRQAEKLPHPDVDRAEWLDAAIASMRQRPISTSGHTHIARRRGGQASGVVRSKKAKRNAAALRKLRLQKPHLSWHAIARLHLQKDSAFAQLDSLEQSRKINALVRAHHRANRLNTKRQRRSKKQ